MTSENWNTVPLDTPPSEGEVIGIKLGGRDLAVYQVGGVLYATDNICTHAFALLSEGYLEGHMIECPLHAGRFDIRDGKGQGPPISCNIRTYPVRLNGAQVEVAFE